MPHPSNITLAQLRFICAAVETGSFRKAAKHCRVSQPTMSVQIQQLEDELGVQIFNRQTRPLSITPEGEKLLEQAKVVVAELEKLHSIAKDDLESTSGELRIGVIATLTPYLVPRFAPKFVAAHPDLNFVVDELLTESIYKKLDSRELDIGIVAGPVELPQFLEQEVFSEPFVAYFAPDHPLLAKDLIKPNELRLCDAWLLAEGHFFRDEVLQLCRARARRNPATKRLWFESGSMETIRELVDAGEGYTLFPTLAVEQIISRSSKKRLRRFAKPEPFRRISLIHGRHYNRPRMVAALVAAMRASLPADLKLAHETTYRHSWDRS